MIAACTAGSLSPWRPRLHTQLLPCPTPSQVCLLLPFLLCLVARCLQGVGGPCCARILTTWFASKERGTYWGMWNIAHNLGGFAAPLVAGGFAKSMGWQWGMWAPGIIGLVVGCFVLLAW